MIVLNENDWARDAIENRSLGKHPYETLSRVARYYLDDGYSKKETRRMLDQFILQCDPVASLPKWSSVTDFALDRAVKRPALCVDSIAITEPEMNVVDSLDGKQLRRLAFVLLCLAKYWDLVNAGGDHWVNNGDNEIMRMANVSTTVKRQSMMYAKLRDAGLIQFSKKIDNTNVRVCFIQDGKTVLEVSDYRNLGYQYLKYHGGPFYVCENCGITVRGGEAGRGRKLRYCKQCAAEIATQQRINSVMRQRNQS